MKINKCNLIVIAIFFGSVISSAQFSTNPEIGIVEHLEEYLPDTIYLVNENADTVLLKNIIDKPTIFSLVYYRCPGICSPLMSGIADVIDNTDLKIDEDYQVFTVSFNPEEDSKLAVDKKRNYLHLMSNVDAQNGWYFFTADSTNIKLLTKALGFAYAKQGNDYQHAAALMAVSPKGKITRYLNGTVFKPFELKMAVIEASKGKSGPTLNKILQFCISYDASEQRYVLNITRVAGGIIMLIAILLFLTLVLKPVFKKRTDKAHS